ncbi:hypothetical protein EPI10_002177 [Gossypium australe]|uniref:Uncharacterized protein n=1 Tax=Gossypium australe TaxID=47621 RepID=A0A5B6VDA0_9ROSI|nr:hypothetical protein EPI10_002177 [Gossypium australe]
MDSNGLPDESGEANGNDNQKEKICIGAQIYRSMIRCAREKKVGLIFPHIVMTLCKKEKVPMDRSDIWFKPSKNPIGDAIYKHYLKVQVNQMKKRNDRKKKSTRESLVLETKKGIQRSTKPRGFGMGSSMDERGQTKLC